MDTPLIVVTTAEDTERAGCLVGFHSQSSIGPPRYCVWLSKANHTYRVALRSSHLAIHFLAQPDVWLAERFGTLTGDRTDKFAGLRTWLGPGRVPVLEDCPRWFVARRNALLDEGGDHVCLTCEPVAVHAAGPFDPLRLSQAGHLEPGHGAWERPSPPTERASSKGLPCPRASSVPGTQFHAAFARPGIQDGRHGRRAEPVDHARQERLVDLAHHLRFLARERMERAIAQPHPGGRFPGGLEAGPCQQPAGQGQRALGAQPSRAGLLPLGGADVLTAPEGHAQRRRAGGLMLALGYHGVQQDASQDVVTALRDADLQVRLGRLIHLRGAADPAGRLLMRAERPGIDELVQVKRCQLA
jgi:flavin reductase (DIM6/NTAB) family NADH-FMN oxidoreductase RutF